MTYNKKLALLGVILFTSTVAFGMEEKKEESGMSATYFGQLPRELKVEILINYLREFAAQERFKHRKELLELQRLSDEHDERLKNVRSFEERMKWHGAPFSDDLYYAKQKLVTAVKNKIEELKQSNDNVRDIIDSNDFKIKIERFLDELSRARIQ